MVHAVAADELLLREGHELARLDEVGALKVPRRAEGPAAAALALILDGRHRALLHPVDRVGQPLLLRPHRRLHLVHAAQLLLRGRVVEHVQALGRARACQLWFGGGGAFGGEGTQSPGQHRSSDPIGPPTHTPESHKRHNHTRSAPGGPRRGP